MIVFDSHCAPKKPAKRTRKPGVTSAMKRREHFEHYALWARASGINPEILNVSAIAAYIEAHATRVGYLTQQNRVRSLKHGYTSRGFKWPPDASPIRVALSRVRDNLGARASRPVSDDELDELSQSMAFSTNERDIHDSAVIIVACELGMQPKTLVQLVVEQITFDGTARATIRGLRVHTPLQSELRSQVSAFRCPVRALRMWMEIRDPSALTLFYLVAPNGQPRPMNGRDLNGLVMRRMKSISRTAQHYSALSLTAYGLYGR